MEPVLVKKNDRFIYDPIEVHLFDLSKGSFAEFYDSISGDDEQLEAFKSNASFVSFLKTGYYTTFYGDKIVVFDKDNSYHPTRTSYVINNSIVYEFDFKNFKEVNNLLGVVIGYRPRCTEEYDKYYLHMVLNADRTNDNGSVSPLLMSGDFDGDKTCLSFACLSQFYDCGIKEIAEKLVSEEIKVIEFSPFGTIKLTKSELKQKHPVRLGYTVVGNNWHRSPTVLLHDTVSDFYILMGQDEGAYFGVELPEKCKTIQEAFEILAPPQVKDLKIGIKNGVQRQGEWFAVPVKNPPSSSECCLIIDNLPEERQGTISLGKDTEESADHIVYSSDIRVGLDGVVYAFNPVLEHSKGDHEEMQSFGWTAYYKNTAARSYSQKGVD